MTEQLGRRELKRRSTGRALSASAWRLAVEKGPDGVTTDEIALAAGVSPRTFFNYFLTKEDAILGPIFAIESNELLDLRQSLLERPADEGPFQALLAVMTTEWSEPAHNLPETVRRARFVKEHPSLLPRYLAAYALLEENLTEALAERMGADLKRDNFPRVVVSTALAALRVTLDDWTGKPESKALVRHLRKTFDRLSSGEEL